MNSIIIPAHNEENRIGRTLEEYGNFFQDKDTEILVVINNTQDKTERIVQKYQRKFKFIRYLNFKQGGKGFAIMKGFKDSIKRNHELIGFVDADMATSPQEYYNLMDEIEDYDGIIGSRYLKDSIVNPKQSTKRIIGSRLFNSLVRCILSLPYLDTQCGLKIFKRDALKKVIKSLIITQWAFDVNLLYNLKKNRFKIKEHPTTWADMGGSKVKFLKTGIRMGLACIRLRLVDSEYKFLIDWYDRLPNYLKITLLIK